MSGNERGERVPADQDRLIFLNTKIMCRFAFSAVNKSPCFSVFMSKWLHSYCEEKPENGRFL